MVFAHEKPWAGRDYDQKKVKVVYMAEVATRDAQ